MLLVLFSTCATAGQAVVSVDHFPPWKIVGQEGIHGIDIELVTALLEEADMTPSFESCPWPRCLNMIETGEADIVTGILKRPERERTMHFIEPPYKTKSSKAFYILKGSPDIVTYEDLHGKVIGVLREAKHFKRFDEDNTLKKEEIHANELNFMKLAAGRVDTTIATESIGDYLIAELGLAGKVAKATYRHDTEIPVYFAVSRKSPLMPRIDDLEKAAKRLRNSGRFNHIIQNFFKNLSRQP